MDQAERMGNAMNISGITQTAQILPPTQQQPQPPTTQQQQVESTDQAQVMQADAANFSAQVSTQVMDMAVSQFEDAANELIASIAATSGIGQSVDVSV